MRRSRWVAVNKTIKKSRPIYRCKSGWKQSYHNVHDCTTAKCLGCFNGGRCDKPYQCTCATGWEGSRCRTDINECSDIKRNPCSFKGLCKNLPGAYSCSCPKGFYLSTDGKTCIDIDECLLEEHECDTGSHADCKNTQGSYKCVCPKGYYLESDERTCKDIDECQTLENLCSYKQGCQNTAGGYVCSCMAGYYLGNDQHTCKDVDECATGTSGCIQKCTNMPGSFFCSCDSGYSLSMDKASCVDVDECTEGTAGCTHKCTNTLGSFQCFCDSGYSLSWDKKSCFDIDECKNNQHGCTHTCKNSPGSYRCLCRKGFDLLKDGRHCIGRPCFQIFAPRNGNMTCSGYSTEDSCHFSCPFGFELVGSRNRTCTAAKMWSGIQTECKRLQCPEPPAPINGFIYYPCITHIGSQCLAGCEDGFYINGTGELTCSNKKSWEPGYITCNERKACEPNPCLHGGTCISDDFGQFHCDCSETGYKGKTCDVGIVLIPDFPILAGNAPSKHLKFRASPPEDYLVVTPVSVGVEFHPPKLVFKKNSTTAKSLTLTSKRPGLHSVRYYLSGPSAAGFQFPESGAVLVKSSLSSSASISAASTNRKPHFSTGCYDIALDECTHSGEVIVASSTVPWRTFDTLAVTSGAVSLSNTVTRVPYSLVGASFKYGKHLPKKETCLKNFNDITDTEWLIKKRALTESFLKGLRGSLPKWLDIQRRIDTSVTEPILQTNVQTLYLPGKLLRQKASLEGQPIMDSSYYSLLLSSQVNLIVGDDVLSFGLDNRDVRFSVAIDLCTLPPTNVILRPSLQDIHLINNLHFVKRLKQHGWTITIRSVQFSKRKTINSLTGWSFNTNTFSDVHRSDSVNGSLAMFGSFSKLINITDNIKSRLTFQGTMVMDAKNIDRVIDYPFHDQWKADVLGNVQIEMEFPVHGNITKLTMKMPETKSYATFGANYDNECQTQDKYNGQGFVLKGTLAKRPFLATDLNQFVELDTTMNMSCFISIIYNIKSQSNRSVYNEVSDGITTNFRGTLKFGPLRFDNFDIEMKVKNQRCSVKSANTVTEFNGRAHDSRKDKLGIFEIHPDTDLNLRILVDQYKGSKSKCSFQAIVNILGFLKTVNVNVSNEGLRFSASGDIHGLFKAFVTFKSELASWERQRYSATGTFENNPTKIDSLNVRLEDEMKVLITNVLKRARFRRALSSKAENRAIARLKTAQSIQNRTLKKMNLVQKEYGATLRGIALATEQFSQLENSVQNSSNDVQKLRTKLLKLCKTKLCPNVCSIGKVCRVLYYDHIVEKVSSCNGTCHTSKRKRIPPNQIDAKCQQQRCARRHRSGLLGNVFGRIVGGVLGGVPGAVLGGVVGFFAAGKGSWNCRIVSETCSKPNFNYRYLNTPYRCVHPCQEKSVFNTTNMTTCNRESCGTVQRNYPCLLEKSMCKRARKSALVKISKTSNRASKILEKLARAQSKTSLWEIKKQKAEVKLQFSWRLLNASNDAVVNLEKIYNMTKEARKKTMKALKKPLQLRGLLGENEEQLVLFKIERIDFNVKVSAEHASTLLPLHITYVLNGTRQKLSTVLDFNNLNTSIKSITKEMLSAYIGDTSHLSRRRRSVDTTSSSNSIRRENIYTLQTFHRLCSEFHNRLQIIHDVIMTLHRRASDMQRDHEISTNPVNENDGDVQVSLDQIIALEFGLDVDNQSLYQGIKTDPVMREAKDLQKQVIDNTKQRIRSDAQHLLQSWLANMETVFGDFSDECSGLEDCFKLNIDQLSEITFDSNPAGEMAIRDHINAVWQVFSQLARQYEMTMDETVHLTDKILRIVTKMRNSTEICSRAPNITEHPTPYKELREREELVLSCNATGDFVEYQWIFNGDILKNQSTNLLRITNTTLLDSGYYLCEAFNHIDKVTSSPSIVAIGASPIITRQPRALAYLILSNYDSLVCEAKKSAPLNISYQWWFKSLNSKTYVVLRDGIFPYLNFDPVRIDHQGWYFCNISNIFGSTISRTSYVQVLNYSLPVPEATISFTVTREYRRLNNTMQNKKNVSYEETLRNVLASRYPFNRNASQLFVDKRIKELTPRSCQTFDPTSHLDNDMDICDWELTIVGKNITSTNATEQAVKNILQGSDLKSFIGKLENAIDSGHLSFFDNNINYSFQKSSVAIRDFSLLCPFGQQLVSALYKCVICPSGMFGKLEGGKWNCIPCPIGFYQGKPGERFCNECSKGFTTIAKGSYERDQCIDERKFFLAFKIVNNYHGDALVNITVSSVSQVRLLRPLTSLVNCEGWKTKKSITLTAMDPTTNQTIDISGQSEIRIAARRRFTSLNVLHILGKQADKDQFSATFVLVSRYHNPVIVTVTTLRSRTIQLNPGRHVWFLTGQMQKSDIRNEWLLKAVDVASNKTVYINGESSVRVWPGVMSGFESVLYIDASPRKYASNEV